MTRLRAAGTDNAGRMYRLHSGKPGTQHCSKYMPHPAALTLRRVAAVGRSSVLHLCVHVHLAKLQTLKQLEQDLLKQWLTHDNSVRLATFYCSLLECMAGNELVADNCCEAHAVHVPTNSRERLINRLQSTSLTVALAAASFSRDGHHAVRTSCPGQYTAERAAWAENCSNAMPRLTSQAYVQHDHTRQL